ncbi:MAG: hypothetical protein HY314_06850 [Acidobacteria bacterium]|nr:hypothetical protein [Acidobacteriota bacterium]
MKRVIVALIIVAVIAVVVAKLISRSERTQPPPASLSLSSKASTQGRLVLYLSYDQVDQDASARQIYADVDRAERELAGKLEVRRVDVDREMNLVKQFQVRVLPTILLVSPSGAVTVTIGWRFWRR